MFKHMLLNALALFSLPLAYNLLPLALNAWKAKAKDRIY